jgi:hypothetical protein
MKQNLILELGSEIQRIKELNAFDRSLKDDLNQKKGELRYQVGSNQKEKWGNRRGQIGRRDHSKT